ncbi:hypothetical protein [Wenzhouxiangella marina]|uniref:Uncharacterized protein n=1 Tax=Wenzhouxiangella marina TaxID=1579979 RepID=A0A0K0XV27_9GAMM|nr:hypothetical protein [Wenzhouxiangella marina]AKS41520.1 hypothetical protein WM2015_1146 [Wenzhouxiangella marina]MBB6086721.1 hypothetical protein [Wenzhouxiangella marina]
MRKLWMVIAVAVALTAGPGQTLAAPPGAVPVYCTGVAFQASESNLTCRRGDTRATVSTVPEGMFLHITDIVVNPNNTATSGTYSILVGRDDGTEFPGTPSVELLGEAAGSYHFSTPYIVLSSGEAVAARVQSNSVLSAMDVRASGYLASTASP